MSLWAWRAVKAPRRPTSLRRLLPGRTHARGHRWPPRLGEPHEFRTRQTCAPRPRLLLDVGRSPRARPRVRAPADHERPRLQLPARLPVGNTIHESADRGQFKKWSSLRGFSAFPTDVSPEHKASKRGRRIVLDHRALDRVTERRYFAIPSADGIKNSGCRLGAQAAIIGPPRGLEIHACGGEALQEARDKLAFFAAPS